MDLLQRVKDRFKNANTFDIKGTASAAVPGSSWRANYEFETQGAQPAFLPLSAHSDRSCTPEQPGDKASLFVKGWREIGKNLGGYPVDQE